MIKTIKYSVYLLMALIFILYCGETAYDRLYDRLTEDLNCIVFDKGYDKKEMAETLDAVSEKYDLCAVYPIYEFNDSDVEIYCCTNGSTAEIRRKLGAGSCDLRTILSGSFSLRVIDESERDSYVSGDYVISAFYFSGDDELTYKVCSELAQKYEFGLEPHSKKDDPCLAVGIICTLPMLLMAIYDMLDRKKEICIRLTLGNSLSRQLAKVLLTDTLVFIVSGLLTALIMYRFTAVLLILKLYILFLAGICLVNAAVFMGIYLVDVCSSLKNENSSAGYLPINYLLKTVASVSLLCALCFAGRLPAMQQKKDSVEYFKNHYHNSSRIELSESPKWAVMIDSIGYTSQNEEDQKKVGILMDRVLADYDRYIGLLDKEYGTFLLSSLNFYPSNMENIPHHVQNIVLASDIMDDYIYHQTGVSPAADGITVMLPERYDHYDKNTVEEWLEMMNYSYSFDTHWIRYKSGDVAVIDQYDDTNAFATDMYLNVASSPIIIYVPHAADYDYLNYHIVMASTDRKNAMRILNTSGILSVRADISSADSMAGDYIRSIDAVTILFLLISILAGAYYIALLTSTLTVDITVNKRERAVRRILGRHFVQRYLLLFASFAGSLIVSAVIALEVNQKFGIGSGKLIVLSAAVLLVFEVMAVIIAAKLDEKNNTLKELKGGAL